jgi:glycosyltransferase involved in cell wall biosynthesis
MLIYSYFSEATGGAERQCRLQARELVKLGHECLILTTRQRWTTPRWELDQGCEVIRCRTAETFLSRFRKPMKNSIPVAVAPTGKPSSPAAKGFGSRAAVAVRWLNAAFFMAGAGWVLFRRRRKIDVLHAHGADWHAGFAGWIGHRLSIPVVCKGANVPVFPPLTGLPFARTLEAWRRRVHYIALTPAMRDDLVANGVASERITVLPNGVEIPAVEPSPSGELLVLHVANYTQPAWNKAFDVLFGAWPCVARECPAARLVAAGAGDVSRWQRQLAEAGCADRVDFIGYRADLEEWFRRAAIFVLPSRHEGISNALLEAQSFGIPAVVSDIPGNRAVVVDGVTGLVVPAGDEAALAQALIRLLADPDLRSRMGNAARRRMAAEFGIGSIVRQMSALYRQLAAGKDGHAS